MAERISERVLVEGNVGPDADNVLADADIVRVTVAISVPFDADGTSEADTVRWALREVSSVPVSGAVAVRVGWRLWPDAVL